MLYTREEIVSRILDLFFARRDVYARSFIKPDGTMGYSPSCACSLTCWMGTKCPRWRPQEVTGEAIYAHMAATLLEPFPRTIGVYSTSQDNEVKWIVLDIDAHSSIKSSSLMEPRESIAAYQTLKALHDTLDGLLIPHYIEESGMGWHIWIFTPPISAEVAYKAGKQIVAMTEDIATDVEIFPKQSSIAEGGFGNLVKLPYGLHWSLRKCMFITIPEDNDGYYNISDQWEYLLKMRKVEPLQLQRLATKNDEVHRTFKPLPSAGSTKQEGMLPGPPCVSAMWRAQLRQGDGRNQVLHQLAVNLQRSGFLDVEQAKEILSLWNQKQIDPLEETEFDNAIEHAYNGNRYSYGSERPIIAEYCNVERCPICDNPNAKLWDIWNMSRGIKR